MPEQKANRLDLTGVFGLVAPLAATLGVFKATGSIERIQRDEPGWLFAAVALVLAAGTLVTIASFLAGEGQGKRSKSVSLVLYGLAILATIGGFGLALNLVFDNADDESRPSITASLNEDQSWLTAQVTAANLTTGDRLGIKVDLATLRKDKTIDKPRPFERDGSVSLERAYIGPDSDGDVDRKISLAVPPGGDYTHVTIKAFTGERNRSCTQPRAEEPDPGTACTFLAVAKDRGS
ncbi:MAG TPA: hypothetical protein VFY48_02575 [Solirubrobacterales bacterium]|nr:hypothetical protein [Solirubrobacterales bacterium]